MFLPLRNAQRISAQETRCPPLYSVARLRPLPSLFVAAQSPAALAITGGVSVEEALAVRASSRYTEQQVAFARAVSAVTVALINVAGAQANGQGTSLCSATIVHPRAVLTAAHCVLNGREVSRRMIVLFEGGASPRQALDSGHPSGLPQDDTKPDLQAADPRRPVIQASNRPFCHSGRPCPCPAASAHTGSPRGGRARPARLFATTEQRPN